MAIPAERAYAYIHRVTGTANGAPCRLTALEYRLLVKLGLTLTPEPLPQIIEDTWRPQFGSFATDAEVAGL